MSNQPWFFAPGESWGDGTVELPADESHHATKVVRVAAPDVITVTDGNGRVARCAIDSTDGGTIRASILDVKEHPALRPRMVVYQGVAKGGKVDDVVEKLAEMGVAELWTFSSERSVAKWDSAKVDKLGARWDSISRAAAKQSRNPYFLRARAGLAFDDLVERVRGESFAVTLWEEASLPLRTVLDGIPDRVAMVVGPEGGLTRDEAEALADAGSPLVSLGPRILRTENAAVVTAAALQFHFGAIG